MELLGGARTRWITRIVAILFLSAPGLVETSEGVVVGVVLIGIGIGFACLLISLQFQDGVGQAIELLLLTNVAFWCFVILRRFVPYKLEYALEDGEGYLFLGTLIIWLVAFGFALLYEILIFLRVAVFGGNHRRLAVIGVGLVAVQLFTVMRFILATMESTKFGST